MKKSTLSLLLVTSFAQVTMFASVCRADWRQDALVQQVNYIADCSYTADATNHAGISANADGYGVINNVRIVDRGPDWVNQSTDSAMGLIAATVQLKKDGVNTERYDRILHAQYATWLLANRQPFDVEPSSPNFGGASSVVTYDNTGHLTKKGDVSSGATGLAICSMWKYGEYLRATGQSEAASAWIVKAWPLVKQSGAFLLRNVNHRYGLVETRSDYHDLWLSESVFATDAMQCLAAWASAVHVDSGPQYIACAKELRAGMEHMRDDTGTWKDFYKFRSASDFTKPQYGDSVDQLGFAPYEFDALEAGEPFAKQISDWWTNGASGVNMTPVTQDPTDWRDYGVHWHYYFDKRAENNYLYPGPALQLAAVEWKYWKATGDPAMLERAKKRYAWVTDASKSGLDYIAPKPDGGVNGGIIDWCDSADRTHTAPSWQRFSDTSAYCIYCTLMIGYDVNPCYVPTGASGAPAQS